jgi:hypothetical protein
MKRGNVSTQSGSSKSAFFPYVELSDVPRLQQVEKKKCRTAEESRTTCM